MLVVSASKEGVRVEKERVEKECEKRRREQNRSASRKGVRVEKERIEKECE